MSILKYQINTTYNNLKRKEELEDIPDENVHLQLSILLSLLTGTLSANKDWQAFGDLLISEGVLSEEKYQLLADKAETF